MKQYTEESGKHTLAWALWRESPYHLNASSEESF